ncbi:zinc finger and SCAN domain-containing protein 29-like [Gopherus flavomarginatus]|uniref:zinc finger and SCAN domain-containing protein 29-like n=1 Tax=Gopherus flavomarginatus TaxID=286002 RepID=UPI0021CBCBA2|nr:zinc finger and SCAN domain-containing protein 29-like [Gopherus flavomarginatus]
MHTPLPWAQLTPPLNAPGILKIPFLFAQPGVECNQSFNQSATMPPHPKRAPAWNNSELQDLISVWGEEAVQAQLRSRRRNYDTYGQISQSLLRRGHERDALQCRVKIKELRSAYCKAREGNRCSGAAPTTCHFYKELDAILGCDPTANPRTTMESSEQGEVGEGVEEADSEATGVEGDTPESQEACSQELFSSQEEASQSQQLEVAGEEKTEKRARVTLTNAAGSPASRRLQNLRKNPRKSKEELIKAVMIHYNRESRKTQEWREKMYEWRQTESRRKELAIKKTSKQMISLLARQTESFESLLAMQADLYRGNPHPSQSSLSCSPVFAQNTFLQQPVSYYPQLPPTPVRSPTSPDKYNSYPVHSTPITLQHSNPEVQQTLNSNQNRTYSNL